MNAKLPHPADLTNTQALLVVDSYDEYNDAFNCTMHTAAPCEGQPFMIPALLLPMLTHEYDDPHETCGRTFLVERGLRKDKYARLHAAVQSAVETFDHQQRHGDAYTLSEGQVFSLCAAMNAVPDPIAL